MPAERAIEESLSSTAKLMTAVMDGRADLAIPFADTQHTLNQVAAAQQSIVEARQAMIRAHKAVTDLGAKHGIDPVAFGDFYDCPPVKGELPSVTAHA